MSIIPCVVKVVSYLGRYYVFSFASFQSCLPHLYWDLTTIWFWGLCSTAMLPHLLRILAHFFSNVLSILHLFVARSIRLKCNLNPIWAFFYFRKWNRPNSFLCLSTLEQAGTQNEKAVPTSLYEWYSFEFERSSFCVREGGAVAEWCKVLH